MITTDFYKAIMARLLGSVSGIAYFDLYNSQPDSESQELNYNTPAVFFEYMPLQWKSLGEKTQIADCEFNLYVQTESLGESSNLESENEQDMALSHLDLCDRISRSLHGFSGTGFGTIARTGTVMDSDHGNQIVTLLSFKTRLTDDSMQPEKTTIFPVPPLEIQPN